MSEPNYAHHDPLCKCGHSQVQHEMGSGACGIYTCGCHSFSPKPEDIRCHPSFCDVCQRNGNVFVCNHPKWVGTELEYRLIGSILPQPRPSWCPKDNALHVDQEVQAEIRKLGKMHRSKPSGGDTGQ